MKRIIKIHRQVEGQGSNLNHDICENLYVKISKRFI